MLLLEGKRPLLVEDLSCFPFLYKLVPSVWNGVESVRWCYEERDLDGELCVCREIELYKLKRDYNAVSYTHLDVYKRQGLKNS